MGASGRCRGNPENAAASTAKDLLPFLTEGFTAAAMAKVGTSAIESRKIGYLLDTDVIVPNKDELLFVAINEAKALFNSGYRAPHKRPFAVAGRSGILGHSLLADVLRPREGLSAGHRGGCEGGPFRSPL